LKIVCQIAGHRRSAKAARFDYDAQRWRSVCKHCGTPMARDGDGVWSILEAVTASRDQ